MSNHPDTIVPARDGFYLVNWYRDTIYEVEIIAWSIPDDAGAIEPVKPLTIHGLPETADWYIRSPGGQIERFGKNGHLLWDTEDEWAKTQRRVALSEA